MQKVKISHSLQRYILPFIVLILLMVFFFYCRSRVQTEFPVLSPEDGVVDIRDVDFDAGVYHLENHWDYYSGKLYTPQELTSPDAPQKDKKTSFNDEKGTWRIVLLAKPNTYLSLCSFSVDFSTRVFVNGSEVRNIGFVSDDPAETTPMVRYMTLPLYSGDDYLAKPYDLGVFLARVEARLRASKSDKRFAIFGRLRLDTVSMIAFLDNTDLMLTQKEFLILLTMIKHVNTLVSKDDLYRDIWSAEPVDSHSAVYTTVSRLNKKLDDANAGLRVTLHRGEGYALEEI